MFQVILITKYDFDSGGKVQNIGQALIINIVKLICYYCDIILVVLQVLYNLCNTKGVGSIADHNIYGTSCVNILYIKLHTP